MSQNKYNPGRDQSPAVAVMEKRVQPTRLKFNDNSDSKIKTSASKKDIMRPQRLSELFRGLDVNYAPKPAPKLIAGKYKMVISVDELLADLGITPDQSKKTTVKPNIQKGKNVGNSVKPNAKCSINPRVNKLPNSGYLFKGPKILKNPVTKKETKANTTNFVTSGTKQVRPSTSSNMSAPKSVLYKNNSSKTNKPHRANEELLLEKLDNKDVTKDKPLDNCECLKHISEKLDKILKNQSHVDKKLTIIFDVLSKFDSSNFNLAKKEIFDKTDLQIPNISDDKTFIENAETIDLVKQLNSRDLKHDKENKTSTVTTDVQTDINFNDSVLKDIVINKNVRFDTESHTPDIISSSDYDFIQTPLSKLPDINYLISGNSDGATEEHEAEMYTIFGESGGASKSMDLYSALQKENVNILCTPNTTLNPKKIATPGTSNLKKVLSRRIHDQLLELITDDQ